MREDIKRWLMKVESFHKSKIAAAGGDFGPSDIPRFSSGIVKLDVALGGGWPFSKINILAGEESTGKTLICLKAMKSIQEYDHWTKKHISKFSEDKDLKIEKFSPGVALFVDIENSWEDDWAEANGVNVEDHVIARPDNSQQALDLISNALAENVYDLIILDSIPAMTPIEVQEAAAGDWQIGLAARLNNKAFLKWVSIQNRLSVMPKYRGGPAIIMLNQFAIRIGTYFGDPRTLPGGRSQRFAASTVIYTNAAKYPDAKVVENHASVRLSGKTHKNKTYIPRIEYDFELGLRDTDEHTKGEIDNIKPLVDEAKALKLLKKGLSGWTFGTYTFSSEKEVRARLKVDETLMRSFWRSVVKGRTEYLL